jgi:glycosyltransferase involved in cell wall biosynthesis
MVKASIEHAKAFLGYN